MAELAEWDDELLAIELHELNAADFDMALLGFDAGELSAAMGLDEELDGDAPKLTGHRLQKKSSPSSLNAPTRPSGKRRLSAWTAWGLPAVLVN